MKKSKYIGFIILALTFVAQTFAQEVVNEDFKLFTKFNDDGVMIKIAPQKSQTWLKGAENGYIITRYEIGKKGSIVLTDKPPKPYTKEDWEKLGEDSLFVFNQKFVFDKIAKSKNLKETAETIKFYEDLKESYGMYFLFTSRVKILSKGSGLEFTDKTAEKNKQYIYEVQMKNHENFKIKKYVETINGLNYTPELYAGQNDHVIELNWEHNADLSSYTCYFIERSEDGKTFERITNSPIYLNPGMSEMDSGKTFKLNHIYHSDTIAQNYKNYYYRLVGVDVWGDEIISKDVFTFFGVDKTPPHLPSKLKIENLVNEKGLKVSWEYNNAPSDFQGFVLYHADSIDGQFIPVSDRIFTKYETAHTITDLKPMANHYFRLAVIDTAGNAAFGDPEYAFLKDVYPPETPKNIKTSIDSNGKVIISWSSVSADDLEGYAVYASNGRKSRLINQTTMPLKDTFFTETISLKRLDKNRFYKLVAIDQNFNYSEYSDTIVLAIPDIVAPSSGYMLNPYKADNQVVLKWRPSPSNDVVKQNIYRKTTKDEDWKLITTLKANEKVYRDAITETGSFEYSLKSVDESGNVSKLSNTVFISIKPKVKATEIVEFDAKKTKTQVELSWSTSGDQPNKVLVYRKANSGSTKVISSVDGNTFIDKNVEKGTAYLYYVKAQSETGVLSSKSNLQKINF